MATAALAEQHGSGLVRTETGYLLTWPGTVRHFEGLSDVTDHIRRIDPSRSTREPFFRSGGATALDSPENALQAVWRALPQRHVYALEETL